VCPTGAYETVSTGAVNVYQSTSSNAVYQVGGITADAEM